MMEAPVSASLGAMGSLLQKLNVLLMEASQDYPGRTLRFPKRVVAGMHLLREDLEEITSYLEDLSEVEDPPPTAKCWMKEVRELSYDMDDYMNSFTWPGRSAKTISVFKMSRVQINWFLKKQQRKGMADIISEFRIRAQQAIERHERYDLDCRTFRRRHAPVGPMLPTHEKGVELITDGRTSEFIDSLANDGDEQLKVIPILGSGGIGKTTLVRVLYKKLRRQFDCQAFVQMSRKPDIYTVLREILKQVQRQQPHEHCEDHGLISKIRNHLQDKRYLIIIDDLWSTSAWDIISHAFPESKCSRIITTTEMEDVALSCCCYNSEYVFEMKPLDDDHSKKLFFNRFFGSESDFPPQLQDISKKIVEICGGFPLATINIAGIFASHPVILLEHWTHVCDSLSSDLRARSTSEGTRLVLNLSYNNLTHYLKTCLLYLNMYPEGCTVSKDDLVKQWVAEGFIDATKGRKVKKVAESYFDELIARRFLQPACIKYNDVVVSCTVHDIVHDLIAYKSVEENFVTVVDYYRKNVALSDKVHRLSLQFGDAEYAKIPGNIRTEKVRSLSFFGSFECMPSIGEFKLLCVLNLQLSGHHGEDTLDLSGISALFQLRYFKVAGNVCIELPKHMQGLQNLETLDMDTKVTVVPWDIIHLPCLLHLHLPFETNLIDWICRMRSDSVQSLGKLTNLQDLRLTCSAPPPDHLERNMEALGSLLGEHGNLKTLALVPGSSHKNAVVRSPSEAIVSWDGFAPPSLERLEWLPCGCTLSRVPKQIGELGNLCILNIAVRELRRDGVAILRRLSALTALSLYVQVAPVERIVFDKGGFLVLKYFKFRCSSVPWLKFEADAMSNLRKLKLGFSAYRVDQHISINIEHLSGLEEISVNIGGAGTDAESALIAAVINHPSNPRINLQSVDWNFFSDKEHEKVRSKPAVVTEDAMVSASTGAMNSLVMKLTSGLVEQLYAKLGGTGNEAMIQKDELHAMKSLLEQLADTDELSKQTKDCRNRMREMTYDIEDCIDDLMIHFDKGIQQSTAGYHERWATLQKFIDQMRDLTGQMENAGLGSMARKTEMRTSGSSYCVASESRLSAVSDKGMSLVGVDGPRNQLVRRLLGGEQEMQVVCILGSVGVGKTTLAKEVYNVIKGRFDCLAFISASKKASITLLLDMLSELSRERIYFYYKEETYLIDKIRVKLQDKRYLIVIDGIWSAEIWDGLKRALPDNGCGSRIIITTIVSDVAESCGKHSSSVIYRMETLTYEDSLSLFRSIIFGSVRSCPIALENVAEKIVKACGGVPLAIRVIAGVLASKPAEIVEWDMVEKRMEMALAGANPLSVEGMRKILYISYSDLSRDMKTCLLYLSAFPDNHVIWKDRLIRRWAAEGFLPKRNDGSWWKTGERYFLELIVRKLIEPIFWEDLTIQNFWEYDEMPVAFKVSGLVHDFITCLSSEQNVIKSNFAESTCMQHDVIRRISVSDWYSKQDASPGSVDDESHIDPSKVRSLIAIGAVVVPNLSTFIHVRVLDLEYFGGLEDHQLQSIGSLSLLRYLGLKGTKITELPKEVMTHEHLLTMDLRQTSVRHLPEFRTWKLVSLLADDIELSRGMVEMQELEELSTIFVGGKNSLHDAAEHVNKLTRLRMLGVRFYSLLDATEANRQGLKHFLKEVGKSNLQSLTFYGYPSDSLDLLLDCWAHTGPRHLQKFVLRIIKRLSEVPQEMASLIALTHLHISVEVVQAEGLRALGNLPNLLLLDLTSGGRTRGRCAVSKDGFQRLKVFCLMCWGGRMGLRFEAGTMPQLRTLWLNGIEVRETKSQYGDFNFGIQHLCCLVQIYASIDCMYATTLDVEAAEAAIREQISQIPNNPLFELRRLNEQYMEMDVVQQSPPRTGASHGKGKKKLLCHRSKGLLHSEPGIRNKPVPGLPEENKLVSKLSTEDQDLTTKEALFKPGMAMGPAPR